MPKEESLLSLDSFKKQLTDKKAVKDEVTELEDLALTGGYTINDNKFTTDGEVSDALGKAIIPAIFALAFFIYRKMN